MEQNDHGQSLRANDMRRLADHISPTTRAPETLLPAMLARFALATDLLPPGVENQEDTFVTALHSPKQTTRLAAVRALGKHSVSVPIEPLVTVLLSDPAWDVRAEAARTLGSTGDRAPIEALVAALTDADDSVCAAAALALGDLGDRAPVEPLVDALSDQSWPVREAAVLALWKLGSRVSAEPFVHALQDKDGLVRAEAQKALQQMHPEWASEATRHVTAPLQSIREEDVRRDRVALATTRLVRPPRRLFPGRPRPRRRGIQRTRAAALIAASLIALISLVTMLRFVLLPPTDAGIGGASFANSSGQIIGSQTDGARNVNDQLHIDLHDLQAPSSGKSYYGWLLADPGNLEAPGAVTALGKLPFSQGKIHYQYQDPQRKNLLTTASTFLITEEDAQVAPLNPSPDHGAWRYAAGFSLKKVSGFSLFDHLQHLLAKDPELDTRGLHGGLSFWCARNTARIAEEVHAAQEALKQGDTHAAHNHFVRMLAYLDGPSVQADVPPGTPTLVNPKYSQVALLSSDDAQHARQGYLQHISLHLLSISSNPDATADQKALASHINEALKKVNVELEHVRKDAKQLVSLPETDLLQSSALFTFNDLVTQVKSASGSQADSATKPTSEGIQQITSEIQHLAAFDIEKL